MRKVFRGVALLVLIAWLIIGVIAYVVIVVTAFMDGQWFIGTMAILLALSLLTLEVSNQR